MYDDIAHRAPTEELPAHRRSADLLGLVVKASFGSFIVNVLSAGVGFLCHVLLARLLGRRDYGIYAYAFSWMTLLGLLATVGLDGAFRRFLPVYRAQGDWAAFRGLFRFGHAIVVFAGVGGAVLALLAVRGFGPSLGNGYGPTLAIAAGLVPLLGLGLLARAGLEAQRRAVQGQIPLRLVRPALTIGFVVPAVMVLPGRMNAPGAMALHVLATLAAVLLGHTLLFRALPPATRGVMPRTERRAWLDMSLPVFALTILGLVLQQIDLLMLGALPGAATTGAYAAAQRLVLPASLGMVAVNSITVPMMAELHETGRHRELQRVLSTAALGIFVTTIPMALVLCAFAGPFLRLFGPGFDEARNALLLLLACQVVGAVTGSVGYLLTMTGYQVRTALVLAMCTAANVALNLVFIPRWGMEGAAFATLLTTIAWNAVLLLFVLRILRVNPTALAIVWRTRG